MSNSYYNDSIKNFLKLSHDEILIRIVKKAPQDLNQYQIDAWTEQIKILKEKLKGLEGHIHFEYSIPRINRRLDNILIIKNIIFVLEFKTGRSEKNSSCLNQAWDYALDLKYFHSETHDKKIVPIAVTEKKINKKTNLKFHNDLTSSPINVTYESLGLKISEILLDHSNNRHIDIKSWNNSTYSPTPTIIEAAKYIYREHEVDSITRKDAQEESFLATLKSIKKIIKKSKKEKSKSICLVTGVPGAGKTLIGLDLAFSELEKGVKSVYASGNRPLVDILRTSLVNDTFQKEHELNKKLRKSDIEKKLDPKIQYIHKFKYQYMKEEIAPNEHVVIFDEAQRAWDANKMIEFLNKKKKYSLQIKEDLKDKSEPEILIEIMDRHKDWCCVVCLIGGGQEIYDGEAGLDGWLEVFKQKFGNWKIYLSTEIMNNREYSWKGEINHLIEHNKNLKIQNHLHLGISQRSFREENLSKYVSYLLQNKLEDAKEVNKQLSLKYKICITRDLEKARAWLRQNRRGSERMGLLATSKAKRLKPYGIVLYTRGIEYKCWYLNADDDIRSSNFLEIPATEFESQGLEIDWACVCWDADLRREKNDWSENILIGSKWKKPKKDLDRIYLKNAYRVILTRARQGLVIFVPKGDKLDSTRSPDYYDKIYNTLIETGIKELD